MVCCDNQAFDYENHIFAALKHTPTKTSFANKTCFTTEPYTNSFKHLDNGFYVTFYKEQKLRRESGPRKALIAVMANKTF